MIDAVNREMTQSEATRLEAIRGEVEELCSRFYSVLRNMGFIDLDDPCPGFDKCLFSTVNDDYDGEERITGRWLDDKGQQVAHFIRYANGSIFAEKDVLRLHPIHSELFIEAIEVWGTPGNLKHEARLLPALK